MKYLLCLLALTASLPARLDARNTPPFLACPGIVTLECTNGTVALVATVTDVDGDRLTVQWTVDGKLVETVAIPAGNTGAVAVAFSRPLGGGLHEVIVTARDPINAAVRCTNQVMVQDLTPPVIHSISTSTNVLWPPNHKFRRVHLNVAASDDCRVARCRVLSVTSNEPVNGLGDGNTSPDWIILRRGLKLYLRAERSGRGSGRVYTVTVECTDAAGNVTTGSVPVFVPHDQGNGR